MSFLSVPSSPERTQVLSQDSLDLSSLFEACFSRAFQTRLEGGGREPLYLPSPEPTRSPHRIIYRADYFASALHEVAHWCVAGARRRMLEDYGYWYAPDGRDADQQIAFEQVEARPQAIEWIFSQACGFDFHLSADNLEAGLEPTRRFEQAVLREKTRYLEKGLPPRAETFRAALVKASRARCSAPARRRPVEAQDPVAGRRA